MPPPGTRLDRFEIRELLGAGGMGEVYRAHDTQLRRDVALKLLSEKFLLDAQRRARFEREAHVLASLNHPNIAALHEVIALPGTQCLVMELVDGETLAERISRGALSVTEALGIGAQVAAALEAAHEQGVVHRDLKPGNVKLRPDGTVKLLDFGLAKIFDAGTNAGATDVTLTVQGGPDADVAMQVLGSPACMSPEQARGLPVDKRTDVWAFGCLLYEMLCGTRAFSGDRASDVIAKILERDPDYSALPPDLPEPIHRLLRRCLEKDYRRRLRDIGDARLELLDVLEHQAASPSGSGPLTVRASRSRARGGRKQWLVAGGVTLVLAAALWFALRPGTAPASLPVTRFTINEPVAKGAGLAISADGRQLAYVTDRGLVVRALDHLDSRVAAPSNLVQGSPFFSPDGLWIGFTGWDALRKVPVAGGEAVTLADRIFPAGAWGGSQIYYGDTRGLFRISAEGGEPQKLLATEGVEQVAWVEVLPERQAVLFTVIPTRGNVPRFLASMPVARIEALDLRTGKRHLVLRGGGRPRLTRTGHLLYASAGSLMAAAFDIERLQVQGKPVPVIQTGGQIEFDVSAQGTLVYQVAIREQNRQLVWVDRKGRETLVGAPAMSFSYPRISPDGQRIAVDVNDGTSRDVWIWDRRRATLEMFTKDPAGNPLLAWSPDGRHLAYGSERSGVSNVYRQAADGSGTPEHLADSAALQMPISYAPDGRLLISVGVTGQQRDIHLMSLQGSPQIRPLIQSPANELWAEVSPDGRWVAYDSDESGQFEIYVRPFPDAYSGSRWQISAAGGRQPVWSRDGRELFYRDYSGAVKAVPVTLGAKFVPGRPETVFEGAGYYGSGAQGSGRTYDVAPDGRSFLMLKAAVGGKPEIFVVLNWFEELRRLAPLP